MSKHTGKTDTDGKATNKATNKENNNSRIPDPPAKNEADTLPASVTFFMTHRQRKKLLALLRSFSSNRSCALALALGITEEHSENKGGQD